VCNLTPPEKEITVIDFRKEMIKAKGGKPLLDAFQLVGIS
jgi:hypothetical protein